MWKIGIAAGGKAFGVSSIVVISFLALAGYGVAELARKANRNSSDVEAN